MTTLARLTLWHNPAAQAVLLDAVDDHLVPILARHGLTNAAPCPRPAVPGLLHHLYAFDTPNAVRDAARALAADPDWQTQMNRLGPLCGPADSDSSPPVTLRGPSASTPPTPARDAPYLQDRASAAVHGIPSACPTA